MKTAVIVTTYNRPDALGAVLAGFEAQTCRQFELLVADDGSGEPTAEVIARFRDRGVLKIEHIWHEDRGFRAAAIRNRAAARATADYLIFTDGDCVPSRRFVEAHTRLAEEGRFLGANRILLSQSFTRRALAAGVPVHDLTWSDWARGWVRRDVNRLLPLLRLPDGAFRRWAPQRWEGIKTCNLSLWRRDLVAVNGLDESYEGWGMEDSDLVIRLLHSGVRHKSARFAAPVFHLWHPEQSRDALAANRERLGRILSSDATRAIIGLDRYGS